jgi:hypothetical protein
MSQESKDIQISLQTTLSALALHKDIDILDDTSSQTSSFTSSSSSSRKSSLSLLRGPKGIPLHLKAWDDLANEQPKSSKDGQKKACNIFESFVEVGTDFGLGGTSCIKILQNAIDVCNNYDSQKGTPIPSRAERISQMTPKTAPSLVPPSKNFVIEKIPIYNVLEAMCWIYTCCVAADEIRQDRDAECYLYQLMLIFKALNATRWLGNDIPTTVAAAWNKPSENLPLIVAFACSCIGKPQVRSEMIAVRLEYVKNLHSLVKNFTFTSSAPNKPGNCPEFVVWGTICRQGNTYRSLCLNINKEMSYKCCNHCDFLAKASEGKSIQIEDWYDKSGLITGKAQEVNAYVGYKLKDIRIIIKEGRGTKVSRTRR